MHVPRVSVLMPVWNAAPYLQAALDSISGQSLADIELVAIDDGSTDASGDLLRRHASLDPRMRVVTRENRGLIATRNELLNTARGHFLAWMDADDVSLPDRLRLEATTLQQRPEVVCVGTWARRIDPEGHWLELEKYPLDHDRIVEGQWAGGAMRFPTTMMRGSVAMNIGGFRGPFSIAEDLDFLMRLSEAGKMLNLCDVTYLYRQHLHSVCGTLGEDWHRFRDVVLQMARERQSRGSDALQRGEEIQIARSGRGPTARQRALVLASWAQAASVNRNFPVALRYAARSAFAHPLIKAPWRTFASVIGRQLVG